MPNNNRPVLKEGYNCWRIAQSGRIAIAIDGEAYFRAVRQAILNAKQSVFILGWDIHSKLRLVRDSQEDDYPIELGALLDFVARKRSIDVYILSWDFAMIYLTEREPFPLYALNWKTHARVRFCMDDKHPIGASQHQKVVVIDDAVAFCGGFDLSKWRWDTSAHRVDDQRRIDPDGKPYPPFHDVQMLVDRDAAAALGELARERWLIATGDHIEAGPGSQDNDPWPHSLDPVMHNVPVALARTIAEYEGRQGVREVEQLYMDSIAAARHFIYIENQYLTAQCINEALTKRLQQDDGLEIVIVMPEKTGGWLEQHTMDVLRARLVKRLRETGASDRVRLYYPKLSSTSKDSLMVHSKVMIIDDCMLRVASSNLSNRSMGLDSECDLALETETGSDTSRAIKQIRLQLLAEHLGVKAEQVDRAMEQQQSLIKAIESLCHGERTLEPLECEVDPEVDQLVPESAVIDPERPIDSEQMVNHFVPEEHQPHTARQAIVAVLILAALLALAAAWRWTALGDWLEIDSLMAQAESLRAHPATPLLVVFSFALAGSLAVPVTLLVVTTVLVFGPFAGFFYSLVASLLSALMSYLVGHGAGRDLVRRFAGKRLNRISKELSKRGILTIITVRIIPVAPFAIINLVAGASHIRLKDFVLGTIVGMLPALIAIAVFAEGFVQSIRDPDAGSFAWLAIIILLIVLAMFGLRKWLGSRQDSAKNTTNS